MRSSDILSLESKVRLNNDVYMPYLGLGTWRLTGDSCVRAVRDALDIGYRLIDTASIYANEEEVGIGIKESKIARKDIFVTTKLWSHEHGYDEAKGACVKSLCRLGLDHVDLYLIHWPAGGRNVETWRSLIGLQEEGLVRAIGVSNFDLGEIDQLISETGVVPSINQVEFNLSTYDEELLSGCVARGIRLEAYSPLRGTRLSDPQLVSIAEEHNKSPAQVVIRWALQKEVVVLAKSSHRERIADNADVFDFSLTPEDMRVLDDMSKRY